MKKVLLVDDEILFRESIRQCIDWTKEGFMYCGDAPDGEVALTMIEQHQPDILITDVSMPFMNGLELCSIVRKSHPDMKIIILSGHGEFEYARTAMRMGVEEYCLKPFSSAEVIKTLHDVSAKIDLEREEKLRIESLKRKESDSLQLTQDKLLNDLCSGFVTTTEAIHLGASLHMNLVARYYVVIVADYRDSAGSPDQVTDHQPVLEQYNGLFQMKHTLLFRRSRTEIVWIMKADSLEQLQEQLQPYKELQVYRNEQSPLPLTIGIGSVQDRLQNVHISFLEAAEDMYWRRLSRQNRHAMWEVTSGSLDHLFYLDKGKFVTFLKIGTPSQLQPFIHDYAYALRDIEWHLSPLGYYILNDLTLEVFRSARDMYRHLTETEELLKLLQQQIGQIHTWDDACQYLTKLTEQFWSWRSHNYDKYGDMLNKVKAYIHANYDKDTISLQDAADHVKVSQSHLSKVFSQETGQTFIEYLTQVRMHKAMELLRSTSAKSYEIAFQVGYNDAHYFSNLFKRYTGKTTKEFRKQGDEAVAALEGE
ncbi:response regulator [Paenibacillus silviterrae]|uniref:response regulator n=1 Tax=Paenibacillus silviterrae TaxID=3242194 RepID=UPI0025428292|nr:response regulator [Paenibacillus chinjuensis]